MRKAAPGRAANKPPRGSNDLVSDDDDDADGRWISLRDVRAELRAREELRESARMLGVELVGDLMEHNFQVEPSSERSGGERNDRLETTAVDQGGRALATVSRRTCVFAASHDSSPRDTRSRLVRSTRRRAACAASAR